MKQYQEMIQQALLGVVQEILKQVSIDGLTGEQYFYITFKTSYTGVVLPDFLKQRYPQEMTIVLQHQFDDLTVTNDNFSVVLSFNGRPEKLTIPFNSIISFADPSEQFALQFMPKMTNDKQQDTSHNTSAEVIDLASVRKKQ